MRHGASLQFSQTSRWLSQADCKQTRSATKSAPIYFSGRFCFGSNFQLLALHLAPATQPRIPVAMPRRVVTVAIPRSNDVRWADICWANVRASPVRRRRCVVFAYHYGSAESHNDLRPGGCSACSQEGQKAPINATPNTTFHATPLLAFASSFILSSQPAGKTQACRKGCSSPSHVEGVEDKDCE